MKRFLITTAAALLLSAGMTYAQQAPEAPVSPPPQAEGDRRPDAPPPGLREPGEDLSKSEWRMHPPIPRERGARFRIENGRTTIDLRCADGEPTKDCADLLLQVLDRLQGATSLDDTDRRDYDRDRDRSRFR